MQDIEEQTDRAPTRGSRVLSLILRAAVPLLLDAKTIRNKGKNGRPNAAIPASGNKSARYRYSEFRSWLAAKFPKEADRLPESYEGAKNIFSIVVSDSDDD